MRNIEIFKKIAAMDLPAPAHAADKIFSSGKPVAAKIMPSLTSDKQRMGDNLLSKMRSANRLQGSQFGNTFKNLTGKFRIK